MLLGQLTVQLTPGYPGVLEGHGAIVGPCHDSSVGPGHTSFCICKRNTIISTFQGRKKVKNKKNKKPYLSIALPSVMKGPWHDLKYSIRTKTGKPIASYM